jgi:hypothetical protein
LAVKKAGTTFAILTHTQYEFAAAIEVSLDEAEIEKAAIVDMNGSGSDLLLGQGGLTLVSAAHGDDLGEPAMHVQVDIQANAGAALALVSAMHDSPGNIGSDAEKGAVDGQNLMQTCWQVLGTPRFRSVRHRGDQSLDDGLQQVGIDDAVEIRDRAARQTGHGKMSLGLPRLAEVFQGPQSTQGGIEKGQQISDDDVVQKELSIAMTVLAKLPQMSVEHSNVLAADDLFWPIRQSWGGRLFAPRGVLPAHAFIVASSSSATSKNRGHQAA